MLATFLLAGTVKGVIGLGLPTISLAILTATLDLKTAMALLLLPSAVTNLWQGAVGGQAVALLRANWAFFATATATVALGGLALSRVDAAVLSTFLGALILAYALIGLAGWRPAIAPGARWWAGPVFGTLNGVFTGMTGSFVVPGVMYLNAIGLDRHALVQAMGILFTLATLALAATLAGAQLLSAQLGLASAVGLVPALIGMALGQRIRAQLSEQRFRRVFFWSLLALGIYIVVS